MGQKGDVLTLTSLSIYPLKSCAELPLTQATVEPLGLRHDRRWMVVDSEGAFMTGRDTHALVHLRAEPSLTGLHLSAPGMRPVEIPLPSPEAPRLDVTVWNDACSAAHVQAGADEWLSEYLGQPVRLVYVDEWMERAVERPYAAPEDRVGFADGYPVLVATEASLADLNRRLARPVGMNRFRPNLVVSGGEAWAEDRWKRLRVGEVELAVGKPCARCVFITVDPERARRDADREPLRTLATFRTRASKVLFGQNLLVRRPGTLKVGDTVEILEAD